MPVVLAGGWCGVLLHEAVGHGLEGDFNRKGTSAFSGLMGKQVTAKGVTIVDDGTLESRRGSLSARRRRHPYSPHTTLIEDSVLTGYLQDRLNARLMGVPATGGGRRRKLRPRPHAAHRPTPICSAGDALPADITSPPSKRGVYATHFGGGQVDITSGKFVFSASEAYLIGDGRSHHLPARLRNAQSAAAPKR